MLWVWPEVASKLFGLFPFPLQSICAKGFRRASIASTASRLYMCITYYTKGELGVLVQTFFIMTRLYLCLICHALAGAGKPLVCYDNTVCIFQLADVYSQGKRLPRGNCSATIMTIISKCWEYQPIARPSFESIATELRELLYSLQCQEREAASLQLQADNGYVPAERTVPPMASATAGGNVAAFAHNGIPVMAS